MNKVVINFHRQYKPKPEIRFKKNIIYYREILCFITMPRLFYVQIYDILCTIKITSFYR